MPDYSATRDITHGLTLDPPTVTCDGCGHAHTDRTLGLAILGSGIEFSPVRYPNGDKRRLCADCRKSAGWTDR